MLQNTALKTGMKVQVNTQVEIYSQIKTGSSANLFLGDQRVFNGNPAAVGVLVFCMHGLI